MNKRRSLIELFEIAEQVGDIKFILLSVKHRDYPQAEIIAVPTANFSLKAQYILNNYTEDLALKNCEDIRIVQVKVVNNEGEIIND